MKNKTVFKKIKGFFKRKVDHKEYILWCAFATMAIYKATTGKDAVVNDIITQDFYEHLKKSYKIEEDKIIEILKQIGDLVIKYGI